MRNILAILILFISFSVSAQKKKDKSKSEEPPKWDVSAPGDDFKYKTHSFTTDEGTWMNLDVSPDGSMIAFDMLGDIYTMPISGGKATAIRTGIPFEVQPRFSPDGSKISFTSDAGGGDNIWVMNADGSDAKQVTKEDFRLLNNAFWTPDGNFLVARKHFTSQRSAGAGEMWQYHISGGGGLQITERKNDQQDVNEPFISNDGRYLYYSEDMYPGGFFQYNKDPNDQIYVIKRYDFTKGETETITGGPGGAARPTVSPNGKLLAFIKRVREKSVLYLHDLETGEEWPVYDKLNKDQQEAWAIFGVYPNFDWMPNNAELIFWSGGKINRLDINSLEVSQIPFEIKVAIELAETVHFNTPIEKDRFTAKAIRQAVTSPDGKFLIFNALGYLWAKELPNGTPKRLTTGTDFEFEPVFSPDGSSIAYVSWNDLEKGAIFTVAVTGGMPKKLTPEKAIYRTPSFSPDGRQLVFRKESGNMDQGFSYTKDPGIYIMNSDGTNVKKVTDEGEYPIFNKDGKRVFLQAGGTYFGNLTKKLISVNLEGNDKKEHIESKYANRIVPSPDNNWVAFSNLHKVYIAALPQNGKLISLDPKTNSVPVQQIARDAGINIHWSPNSKKVMWTLGDEYFSNMLNEKFTFLEGAPDEPAKMPEQGIKIGLSAAVDKPIGKIALTNARIITMEEDVVIESGTIIINGNKIESVSQTLPIPEDARIIDLSGKTVMPGMVDVHAHVGAFRYGLTPQQYWPFLANLAFGVTTAHDPSANTETVFTLSELQKAGNLIGPRLYSTGFILYGADGDFKAVINSLDDARSSIRRTKAFGAKSVKSYNQPRRDQRQQVLKAAREERINVVPEGGSNFFHNLTMVIDGHTGVEHNIPVAPVYKDVLEVWGHSGTGYTPTLIVNYGGLNGEFYYYERDKIWENERLLNFTPRAVIDSRSRHRMKIPQGEYKNGHILVSETANQLSDAGVKVNMGAHGQLQGLGAHWETWMLAAGGMTNMEALKAATINGAEYIGAGNDIGSIKAGKMADLVVLSENPLDAIENTQSIEMVMVNGRLYNAETMNEVGVRKMNRPPLWWENNKHSENFPWHDDTNGFMDGGCSCQTGH